MVTRAQIDLFLSDPDYLKLIGLEREHRLLFITDLSETRVSALLAWFFTPQEGHGLGDQAVRELLLTAWRVNEKAELGAAALTPRAIRGSTFDDLLVYTEFQVAGKTNSKSRSIDLLLVSRRNKLVIAIENKFGSRVHSNQLADYRKAVAAAFPGYEQMLVYLDSDENEPDDAHWIPLDYQWLIDLINTHQRSGLLSARALDALGQFKDYLTDEVALTGQTQPSKDALVARIAQNHPKVLDAFRGFRKQTFRDQLLDLSVAPHEALLIEYCQRHWLWSDVLDQARHSGIVDAAKTAFGDEIEVVSGPAEVKLRRKDWAVLESDPSIGRWVPLVVAWSGRQAGAGYTVRSGMNFGGVRLDREAELRRTALALRDPSLRHAPVGAQWIKLSAHTPKGAAAGAGVVDEIRRIHKALVPVL